MIHDLVVRGSRANKRDKIQVKRRSMGAYRADNGKFRNWPMNNSWRKKVVMTGK
jgi:hypothetical protein